MSILIHPVGLGCTHRNTIIVSEPKRIRGIQNGAIGAEDIRPFAGRAVDSEDVAGSLHGRHHALRFGQVSASTIVPLDNPSENKVMFVSCEVVIGYSY